MPPLEDRDPPGHHSDADSGRNSRLLMLLGVVVGLLVVLGLMALIGDWQL